MPKAGLFAGEVTPQAPADDAPTTKQKGYWWMEYGIALSNCNEIWDIGVLTPDLHVGGVSGGVWAGDLITGIGVLEDDRVDNVHTTNDTDNYTIYFGFNPGVEDGVAEVFYPECQWYNYAGPLLDNQMAGTTFDLSDLEWTPFGTPTFAFADGLDGTPEWSVIMTDNNPAGNEGVFKRSALNSLPNDTFSCVSRFIIAKDIGQNHWARLKMSNEGVSSEACAIVFNPNTGDASLLTTESTGNNPTFEVHASGDWWEVYLQVDADGVSNEMILEIITAWNTDGGQSAISTTGSIRVADTAVFVHALGDDRDMTIGQVRRGALEPKKTAESPSSVIDQSNEHIDSANHDDSEGGYYFEWRPLYSHSEITRDVEILSLNDSTGLLYYDYATQLLTATDGTNTATIPLDLVKETKYRVGIVFGGSVMKVGLNGSWGTEVSYDGGFAGGSDFTVCRNPEAVNYWRELRGFHVTYSSALNEITLLMVGDSGPVPVPFDPLSMTFDGATGRYSKSSVSLSGNKITIVARLKHNGLAGSGSDYALVAHKGSLATRRVWMAVLGDARTNVEERNKVAFNVKDTGGITICNVFTDVDIADGEEHTIWFSYDGDTGDVILYVDGLDSDNLTATARVVTTGTVENGTGTIEVGGTSLSAVWYTGEISYLGMREAHLTNPEDFYHPVTGLKELDTVTWDEWGARPELFAEDAKLDTNNDGSLGAFIKNGTITGPA